MQNKLTISRVVAPAYSKEALEILSKKKGGKFLVSPAQDVISSLKFGIRILMFCRYYKWTSSTNPTHRNAQCVRYIHSTASQRRPNHTQRNLQLDHHAKGRSSTSRVSIARSHCCHHCAQIHPKQFRLLCSQWSRYAVFPRRASSNCL